MNSQYIRLSEVLELMDQVDSSGINASFDIKFVTFNKKFETGGEIIEVKGGRKCLTEAKKDGKIIFGIESKGANILQSKKPDHYIQATRNILLPNGEIRKIHIRLIIEFNGKKVCF
jgi:hypothetical protein